jgi:hypothetical protein
MSTSPDFAFLLALDPSYLRMGTALVHSLNHFHPGKEVKLYVQSHDFEGFQTWARSFRDVTVVPYANAAALDAGEWHPLVWAKLEAFAAPDDRFHVVLDVDQLLFRGLDAHVEEAARSGKRLSASPDISTLHQHFRPGFAASAELAGVPDAPCFNAGAMIVKPDAAAYRELLRLARHHHRHMRLPEQGLLNLWALWGEGHHDMGERFMLQPWSPRVLERDPATLIHFWTPRPSFFGSSPVRSTEPTLEECLQRFEQEHRSPYPLERFREAFELRLRRFAA